MKLEIILIKEISEKKTFDNGLKALSNMKLGFGKEFIVLVLFCVVPLPYDGIITRSLFARILFYTLESVSFSCIFIHKTNKLLYINNSYLTSKHYLSKILKCLEFATRTTNPPFLSHISLITLKQGQRKELLTTEH